MTEMQLIVTLMRESQERSSTARNITAIMPVNHNSSPGPQQALHGECPNFVSKTTTITDAQTCPWKEDLSEALMVNYRVHQSLGDSIKEQQSVKLRNQGFDDTWQGAFVVKHSLQRRGVYVHDTLNPWSSQPSFFPSQSKTCLRTEHRR